MSWRLWWGVLPLALLATAALWLWPVGGESPPLRRDWVAAVGVFGADQFVEPYAVAPAGDGSIYVSDGAGGHRIGRVSVDGTVSVLAGGDAGFADGFGTTARFHTPSGMAVDRNGILYVADTGNDAIRRIALDGTVSTVARGLNGPIGIAVAGDGRLLVSDTYNDRLVMIDASGTVTPWPIAVPLDTPTLIAAAGDTIYVADTGNNVVRAISPLGDVATIDALDSGGWRYPIGVAVDPEGTLFVTDEGARLVEVRANGAGFSTRVIAGTSSGFRNGLGHDAQFRRPAGLMAPAPGRLIVADSGNALLRTVTATVLADAQPPPSPRLVPQFDVETFTWRPLLWPLDPLGGPFEIAGTLGEARGADADRFHAGIDVRADAGSPVLAVRDGVVASPLATGDFGSLNEWLRVGDLTYVHLRVGRTPRSALAGDARFVATTDARGRITRMRVKRGAPFSTGDIVGSVNQFNHVHLNVGWGGEEYNPLLFRLVQFEDTVRPTIAPGGIRLYDAAGALLNTRVNGRVVVSGPARIVVDAWDQANGSNRNRRLGIYSLGYQVLTKDGMPAPGFAEPIETIRFDRLATDPEATRLVYASGSGIPFYGQRRTRFLYIVTNTFRDGVAAAGMWDPSSLPPGDYILRLKVADINGNEALQHRDLRITVTGRGLTTGG